MPSRPPLAARDVLPWLREHAGKAIRRLRASDGRRLRSAQGRFRGRVYHWLERTPEPEVSDDILADRIRSRIGALEKRLDVPRVHVMVSDHVATLHGAVPSMNEASAIESAVSRVSGVRGVESYLHIGLMPGSTRPSEGRLFHAPSPALKRLIGAVRSAGVGSELEERVCSVVVGAIAARIPANEREQLLGHLPADVRLLAESPRLHGAAETRIKAVSALSGTVTAATGLGADKAHDALAAVMAVLKDLVPEESHDVASTLPAELRSLWDAA